MINKFFYAILEKLSESLAKYATDIKAFLAKAAATSVDTLPDTETSIEGAPAYWLAKVRQGAPHLLTQKDDETGADPFSHKIEKQQNQSNSLDQNTLFSKAPLVQQRPDHKETIQETSSNKSNKSNNHHKALKQDTSTASKNSAARSDSIQQKKPIVNFVNRRTENSQPILPQTDSNIFTQKITAPPIASNGVIKNSHDQDNDNEKPSKNSNKTIKKPERPDETFTSTAIKTSKPSLKTRQAEKSTKHSLLTPPTFHLYPKYITPAKAVINQPHFKTPKKTETQQNDTVFHYKNKPLETEQNQDTKSIETIKTLHLTNKTFISKIENTHQIAKQHPLSPIDQSSEPSERLNNTEPDNWPQLPKINKNKRMNAADQSIDFWQIQQQAKYKSLSDLEQRGALWNE